jgi:hypothetical protein
VDRDRQLLEEHALRDLRPSEDQDVFERAVERAAERGTWNRFNE